MKMCSLGVLRAIDKENACKNIYLYKVCKIDKQLSLFVNNWYFCGATLISIG